MQNLDKKFKQPTQYIFAAENGVYVCTCCFDDIRCQRDLWLQKYRNNCLNRSVDRSLEKYIYIDRYMDRQICIYGEIDLYRQIEKNSTAPFLLFSNKICKHAQPTRLLFTQLTNRFPERLQKTTTFQTIQKSIHQLKQSIHSFIRYLLFMHLLIDAFM